MRDALPLLFSALALGALGAQLGVRVFELVGTLLDTAIELAMGTAQRLLAFPKHSLGGGTLGDVQGMAENVGSSAGVRVEDVAVHPYRRAAVAGDHAHHADVLPVLPDAIKVAGEEMTGLGREKLDEIRADAVLGS